MSSMTFLWSRVTANRFLCCVFGDPKLGIAIGAPRWQVAGVFVGAVAVGGNTEQILNEGELRAVQGRAIARPDDAAMACTKLTAVDR